MFLNDVFLRTSFNSLKGVLHDTGTTFVPVRTSSSRFRLLWLCIRLHNTVEPSRQTAKILTVKKGKFLPSAVKRAVVVSRQTASRSFKSHFFSFSSRTAGSPWIVFTGTTRFHVPKYTHFTVLSTNLRLNRQCSWHQNEKVNINFNSWKKSPLDNRQPSKALKGNRQNRHNLTVNRQSYTSIETLSYKRVSMGV